MIGDYCRVVVLDQVVVQENGIIRNSKGYIIGRIDDNLNLDHPAFALEEKTVAVIPKE